MPILKVWSSSGMLSSVIVVLVGAAILTLVWDVLNPRKSLSQIPGPWFTRFTRLPLKLAVLTGQRNEFTHTLHTKYGKVVRLSPTEISAVDEASVRRIYSFTGGYLKSPMYEEMNPFPVRNIFYTCDVKFNSMRRKIYARPFSKAVLRQEWEAAVVKPNVELAVRKIVGDIEKNGSTDIFRWLLYMASDIVATVMFGESFDQLAREETSDFLLAVEQNVKAAGIAYELPLIEPLLKALPIRSLRLMFNSGQALMEYGQIAVTNTKNNSGKTTFFSKLIALEGNVDFSDQEIEAEAAGEIIAGSDTVSITSTYFVWAVISHPEIQKALEEELAGLSDSFNDADLEALPLLNATIDETLRLYGPVPSALPRVIPPEGAILNGHRVPPGIVVSSQAYTIHRDSNMYKDPERFDPYRWLNGLDKHKVLYLPWGAGTRKCPGMNLALMQLRWVAAVLFRAVPGRLKLSPSTTAESMQPENYFLAKPRGGRCDVELAT